jgi:hypothetical protein
VERLFKGGAYRPYRLRYNAELADGSVRFVQDQINLDIWRAAGSTNGGEVSSLH